ncbi:hypothetical protein [Metabacillus idriensis]|nr:hypothetical protein [Metabacillus idriensis]
MGKESIPYEPDSIYPVLARKRGIPASHPGKKKRLITQVQLEKATISHRQ